MLFGLIKPKVVEKPVLISCVQSCPKGSQCPKWVILHQDFVDDKGNTSKKEIGRCADAWIPTLLIELKQAILKGK